MVSLIRFLSEDDMKKFMTKILYPGYFFSAGLKELEKFDGSFLKILVSASPLNYIKYIKDILPFDYILATELDEDFRVKYNNNSGREKVKNINELLNTLKIKIDYKNSYCYTDNYKADKFMAELVKNRFLINSRLKISSYKNLKWS